MDRGNWTASSSFPPVSTSWGTGHTVGTFASGSGWSNNIRNVHSNTNNNNNNNNNNSSNNNNSRNSNQKPQNHTHQQQRRQRESDDVASTSTTSSVSNTSSHFNPQQLNTELINCCKEGEDQQLVSLINRGANVNAELHANPAITFAITNNRPKCVAILLRAGCTKAAAGSMPLLHYALFTSWPSLEMIAALVENGCNVNDRYLQMSPLHIAVRCKRNDVIAYLAERKGADLAAVTKENETLAFIAASQGNTETLRVLLSFPATLNTLSQSIKTSDGGNTPLFAAIENRHFECAKLLIQTKKCKLDEMVKNQTPFFKAAELGETEVLKLLKDHGSQGNVPGKFGVSAIRAATMANHLDTVKYLLTIPSTKRPDKLNAARDAKMLRHDECFLAILENLGMVSSDSSLSSAVPTAKATTTTKLEVKKEELYEDDYHHFEGGERQC